MNFLKFDFANKKRRAYEKFKSILKPLQSSSLIVFQNYKTLKILSKILLSWNKKKKKKTFDLAPLRGII